MGVFIKGFLGFFVFIFKIISKAFTLAKPLPKGFSGRLHVLANGPSLKDELSNISSIGEFDKVDYAVVNFFAFEELFTKIKPKHYSLADPMFFQETRNADNVHRLFSILDTSVDWKMNIYIPAHKYSSFLEFSNLKNGFIKIWKVNTITYSGFESLRYFFYKKSIASPKMQTVAVLAIFVGLNVGYREIELFGVDHSFLDSLFVDENNQLCNRELHFYDDGKAALKPILKNANDAPWTISDYLIAISNMFKGHEHLQGYATYLGASILNCTPNSFIDAYQRRKTIS